MTGDAIATSIVIVSFNSGPLLIECVMRALAASPPCQVVVADNGSSDCSIEPLEELAACEPRLRIRRNGRNLGFARANNLALAETRARHILFLNPDCLLESDTIERVRQAMASRPQVAIAGCRIRNADGSDERSARRHLPTPRRLLAGLLRGNDVDVSGAADAYAQTDLVEAISGAFMLVRRDLLDALGGFDEAYFLHWEDLDLCRRCADRGDAILYVGEVEVVHFKGRSSFRRPLRVEWHKHAGLVRYLRASALHGWRLPLLVPAAAAVGARFLVRALRLLLAPAPDATRDPRNDADSGENEVWVFGASSLIGRWLLPRLVAAGYRVRAFSRDPAAHGAADSTRLTWHACDLTDPSTLPAVGRPHSVINLAPIYTLPPLLATLAARRVRQLIAFSSTSRYTKRDSAAAAERELAAALATAEAAIEEGCRGLDMGWVILRPTMIYSLGHDGNVSLLYRFIRRFGFFPLPEAGTGLRQPIHADELARTCVSLLASAQGWNCSYDLSGGETLSFRALVEAIFRQSGMSPRIVVVPRATWPALLAIARLLPPFRRLRREMLERVNQDLCFAHDAAQAAFGFRPGPFRLR